MAAEGQTSDTERPALAVIEGAGSDNEPSSSDAAHKARSKTRTASKQAAKKREDDAVVLTNELVIPAEQASELRRELVEFTSILTDVVKKPKKPDTTSWLEKVVHPYMEFLQTLSLQRVFSSSIFGRQLTRNELVGEYASLWPALEQPSNLIYAKVALLGASALKAERLEVAQSIIEDLKFATSTPVALSYVMRGVMRFVVAAGLLLYFLYGLTLLALGPQQESIRPDFVTTEPGKVLLAAVFGCLGGVVSLLMRLSEFETTRGRSRQFLLLSGTTLPVVGGIFAAVIASLLASKIINFGTSGPEGLSTWLFIVIGFLAGFSERFTRNLLSIAENQFSRSSGRSDPNRSPRRSP